MVQAYVLIQAEAGKAASVGAELAKIAGALSADVVTGPYDVIVQLQADDLDRLGNCITDGIQRVEGVQRTTTCLSVKLG